MRKKIVVHRRDQIRCFPWYACGKYGAKTNYRIDWRGVNCGNCLKSKPRRTP